MNNLTKGKAAEKKELGYSARNIPRGSQSLTENIITQFCRTPPPKKKQQTEPKPRLVLPQVAWVLIIMKPKPRLVLPQVARVMNKVGE